MPKFLPSLILVGVVAFAAGAQVPRTEWLSKGQLPLTKDKVTFSVLVPVVPEVTDLSTNWFSQWLESKTNVHVRWREAPGEQEAQKQKFNVLVSSGDLPEILLSLNVDSVMETKFGVDEKLFVALNRYIDDPKVMPNLNAWLSRNPEVRGSITAVDGKIYGFPSVNLCYHCSLPEKLWINQDWLRKLNLPMPTTTEELFQVLKAFKEKDPNGNGKADEIPLMGSVDGGQGQVEPFLMSAFVLDPGMDSKLNLVVEARTGKVLSTVSQTAYREGLKYVARLYKAGLYYNGSITQKNDQARQLVAQEPGIVGAFSAFYPGILIDPVAQNATWRAFTVLTPLRGPAGYASTPSFPQAGIQPNRIVFTKALKNPELAARWVDLFYSYEYMLMKSNGEQGKQWRWAKSGELGLDGKPAIWKALSAYSSEPQNLAWHQLGVEFGTTEARLGMETTPGIDPGSPEGLETLLLQSTKKMAPFVRSDVVVMPPVKFTSGEVEDLRLLQVELERFVEYQKVAIITGSVNADAVWTDYLRKLNDLGLERFLTIQQKAYDRQYKAKP